MHHWLLNNNKEKFDKIKILKNITIAHDSDNEKEWIPVLKTLGSLEHLTLVVGLWDEDEFENNKSIGIQLENKLMDPEDESSILSLRRLKSEDEYEAEKFDGPVWGWGHQTFQDWSPVAEVEEGKERPEPVIMTRVEVLAQIESEIEAVGEKLRL